MNLLMKEHKQKGKLITFCGLDGCGKTTMISLLKQYLEQDGFAVETTKQPTSFVRESKMFRAYQDRDHPAEYDYRAVSLLCASDRIQHTNRVIKPWLEQGKIVLCDRYFYSCLANLRARGYEEDTWIYDISQHIVKPNFAFFLDVNVSKAIERIRQRPDEKDSFINPVLQFELRKQYLEIARENGGIIVDSSGTAKETFLKILTALSDDLNLKKRERD